MLGSLADWIRAGMVWIKDNYFIFGEWLLASIWNLLIWLYNNLGQLLLLTLAAIGGPVGVILNAIYSLWNILAAALDYILSLLGYDTIPQAITDALAAILDLFISSFKYLYAYLTDAAAAPQALLNALVGGVQADSFGRLLYCNGDGSFWCGFLTGLDIANMAYGHTIFYPIVIVAITIGTFFIVKREFKNLLWTVLDYVFKI